MKIKPYYMTLRDCYILGPRISREMGQVRIGLSLALFEVGLGFESSASVLAFSALMEATQKVYSYGCSGCGNIGYAKLDKLPPGWEKRYRPDHTYYFTCLKCRGFEVDEDYLVTDENREQAIEEIIGQLTSDSTDEVEAKALRDYANQLLDESEPFSKYDLSASVAAYSDGFTEARKLAYGEP